jgi:hypothetical protein
MFSRYFSLMHLLRCSEFASDRCRSTRAHRHPSTAIPNTTARHLPGRSSTAALDVLSFYLFSSLSLTTTANRASRLLTVS